MRKVSFALVGALFILLAACSTAPPEPIEITILMDEYSFDPSDIELRVGQEVTIIMVNQGALDHEFMIGQNVDYNANLQPTGYEVDFFAAGGVSPTVSGGGMLMDHSEVHGDEAMEGMDHSEDAMGDMDPAEDTGEDEHADEAMASGEPMNVNMVMQPVGSDPTVITFTVTEAMLGDWEIGCFELDGVHYTSGMTGTLTVTN